MSAGLALQVSGFLQGPPFLRFMEQPPPTRPRVTPWASVIQGVCSAPGVCPSVAWVAGCSGCSESLRCGHSGSLKSGLLWGSLEGSSWLEEGQGMGREQSMGEGGDKDKVGTELEEGE